MPKAKVKNCFRSSAGARPPRCYVVGPAVCPPCMNALDIYKQVKAYKATQRIQNNRASAARSRLNKDQKSSDIHSDHLALKTEYEELAQELADITRASQALAAAITVKSEEKTGLAHAKKLRSVSRSAHPSN